MFLEPVIKIPSQIFQKIIRILYHKISTMKINLKNQLLLQILLLMAISFLLPLACCKKDDPRPELPPITTTGANTFGCRVNGKIWLPSKRQKGSLLQIEGGIVTRYDSLGPEKNWYDLLIFADNQNGTGFQIYLSRINSSGNYICNKDFFIYPIDPQPNNSYLYFYQNGKDYTTYPPGYGEVELLRYDTIAKVFSGTFFFTSINGKDTLKVTDGRFDIDQRKIN